MRAVAPGKIIISGEHAVVYGNPALVMAVDRFSTCQVKPLKIKDILVQLPDLGINKSVAIAELPEIRNELLIKYKNYIDGQIQISQVLTDPVHLFVYLITSLTENYNLIPEQGFDLTVTSQLPIGGGMGSSASVIVSSLLAMATHLHVKDDGPFYNLALEAENLLHGRSSGVDPYIALHGGCVKYRNKQAQKIQSPVWALNVAYTGKPVSGTGECVNMVRENFANSSIWSEFKDVTETMQSSLELQNENRFLQSVRSNHTLLTQIGVVPEKVQKFISIIENMGGAAKTCGAGAVRGENAGIVMFAGKVDPEIVDEFGYSVYPISVEENGARII